MFDSVLVANRGEIARRVLRTLHGLGIRSMAIYTEADRDAPHVREADAAELVSSYLAIDEIMVVAARCDAVHPGYGFLSENPAFARACEEMGVVFIGPSADAIELMGDKVRAKAAAEAAGVPGRAHLHAGDGRVPRAGQGGGGRRRARDARGRAPGGPRSGDGRREPRGRRGLRRRPGVPRALPPARPAHRGPGHRRHPRERRCRSASASARSSAGTRRCSRSRRRRSSRPELREILGREATSLAAAAGYVGAGTVEFIADADDPTQHFFLEMNARLQVEHPVTELVTGFDLVELQLRVADGEPLDVEVTMTGHAIEARVNAEDLRFFPSAGPVLLASYPEDVRVDAAVETGSTVGTDYDSMIAKVIAHGPDRATALAKLDRALSRTAILGLETNVGFLRSLLARDDVRAGEMDTGLIGRLDPPTPPLSDEEAAEAWASAQLTRRSDDPWDSVDGWRLGGQRAPAYFTLSVNGGEPFDVKVKVPGTFTFAGEWLAVDGWTWRMTEPSAEELHHVAGDGDLRAPMPGSVLLVPRSVGDEVKAGEPIVVLESMKMELTLAAPADGTVTELKVKVGDKVGRDEIVAVVA